MATIHDNPLQRPALPLQQLQTPTAQSDATGSAQRAAASGLVAPTDATEHSGRVGAPARRTTGNISNMIAAPQTPTVALAPEQSSAASSFANQLNAMGEPAANGDALMAAFLKLAVLDSTMDTQDQGMLGFGRSLLQEVALGNQLNLANEFDTNAATSTQLGTKAKSEEATTRQILTKGGVDPNEIETLYKQSLAAGGDGSDVPQRYAASRPKGYPPAKLKSDLATISRAEPHAKAAIAANNESNAAWGANAGIVGSLQQSTSITDSVRAGTIGYDSMLRVIAENKKAQNQLLALLSGSRADEKGRRQSEVDMDESRIEVAKLVLQIIDQHNAATDARRGGMLG